MENQKAWYASKTIWGSLIAVGAAIVSIFGVEIDADSQVLLIDAVLQIVAVLGSLFAIFGRLTATAAIN